MKTKTLDLAIFFVSLFLFIAIIAMNNNQTKTVFAADVPVECYDMCTEPPYPAACGDHGSVVDCAKSPCGTKYSTGQSKVGKCVIPS
jgi:hypothetical protein